MESWLKSNIVSGKGDKIITFTLDKFTGRNARETNVVFETESGKTRNLRVVQKQKEEFLSVLSSVQLYGTGGIYQIKGTSNTSIISYELGSGNLIVEGPLAFTVNGNPSVLGSLIWGDPGNLAEFEFKISVKIPTSQPTGPLSRNIIIKDALGREYTCLITVLSGEFNLDFNPDYSIG